MKRIVLITLFTLITSTILFAQTGGTIRGVVTDENGAKVAGARVVLNLTPAVQLSTQTNESGTFEFKGLRSGSYLVEVEAEGFSEFTSEAIQLDRAKTEQLAVQLKVAAIKADVVVTATGTVQRAN